jgi:hypothetical protein
MLNSEQKRKVTGAGLIVAGVLFLLVSNNIWLGWGNVWPLFPILAGMLFLRVYKRNRTPEILFGGVATLLMGVFLLFFSLGIFPWDRMESLWPVIPAIAGVSMLAMTAAHQGSTTSLILAVVIVLFAFLGFLHEGGVINERVVAPFIRLWPIVLVVAGATLLRTRPASEDADMTAVREVLDAGDAGPPTPAPETEPEPTPESPAGDTGSPAEPTKDK